ncbi:MAG TPA: iron ABC transporter [Proteiniclasticum sp.]|uniref:FecCD family ABC transporter permease n=1 Tax=Proteiniclasticum sp. TaxID=2053595 RepID=UPI000E9301B0|nr:iron ABC transporter permease [Proteiniclasticum sp.]HBW13612.1 iron ABC transporter [Proteiniclasticum sp.]
MRKVEIRTLEGYRKRQKRILVSWILLGMLLIAASLTSLMLGEEKYTLRKVVEVLFTEYQGQETFILKTLRLPRMLAGVLAGMAFGFAGNTFQKMLKNPLASPDVIGITSGSSLAAVYCLLVLQLSGPAVSWSAVFSGVAVTAVLYILSKGGQFSGGKLILIGIGIQAVVQAAISYMLLRANQYDVPAAMRWMSGNLNGIRMQSLSMLPWVLILCGGLTILLERELKIMELGEEKAVTLGIRTAFMRGALMVSSVCLLAFSTSVTGPISFVAFLSGPIASRVSGRGGSNALASAFVGAILVLSADLLGQYAFSMRFPVGIMTGIIGAPYLLYLLIDLNKKGGSL